MVSAGEKERRKGCWDVGALDPIEQVGSGGQEPSFKSARGHWLRLLSTIYYFIVCFTFVFFTTILRIIP
jgi:hypothetical protein